MSVAMTYRHADPSTNESSEQLTAANVDVLRTERAEIVGGRDGVGRDVDTERDNEQAYCAKGRSSSATVAQITPTLDDDNRVPNDRAICFFGCCGSEDAE